MKKFFMFLTILFAVSMVHAQASDLFFSEYIEGSSNNKALEIFNGTGAEVDLTQYVILGNYNGSDWTNVTHFPSGSTLADGDVWVIANSGADNAILAVADQQLAYNDSGYVVGFNGNDARAIAKINGSDYTIIDVIGVPNEDPGEGWDVAGVSAATKDHTLVRKSSVTSGNTDWAASAGTDADNSEWIVYPKNTFDYIGSHTMNGNPSTAQVTFQVDMGVQETLGNFNPATQDVYIAGNFTDWQNSPIMMSDADGDSTYSVTIDTLTAGETLFFKFIYADQGTTNYEWESVDNRTFTPVEGENSFFAYWDNVEPGQNFADGNITFNVDMTVMNDAGIFDNASDSVQVRGSFNGWSNSDPMGQNILDPNQWFRTVAFTQVAVGTDEAYKFFVNLADTATMWTDGWERPFSQGGGNRDVAFAGTDDQTVDPVYYDDVNPDWEIPAGETVSITFSVDMTDAANDQIQVPTFNPATDTVWWIAEEPAFTYLMGWVDRDDMREVMLTDPDGDMIYTATLSVTGPAWNGFEYRYGFSDADGAFHAEPAGFSDFAYRVRYIAMTGVRTFVQPYNAPQDHWTPQEDKSDQWEAEPQMNGVGDGEGTVVKFDLGQNYPNPFNPTTTIKFSIPQSGMVTLAVYNLLGQKVATLVNTEMNKGRYEYHFDASKLGSGVYFYSLKTGSYSATKKMILMK